MENEYKEITPELIEQMKQEMERVRGEVGDMLGDGVKSMEHTYIPIRSDSETEKIQNIEKLMKENETKYIEQIKNYVDVMEKELLELGSGTELLGLSNFLVKTYPEFSNMFGREKAKSEMVKWFSAFIDSYKDRKYYLEKRKLKPVIKEKYEEFKRNFPGYPINFDEVDFKNPEVEVSFLEAFLHYNKIS